MEGELVIYIRVTAILNTGALLILVIHIILAYWTALWQGWGSLLLQVLIVSVTLH